MKGDAFALRLRATQTFMGLVEDLGARIDLQDEYRRLNEAYAERRFAERMEDFEAFAVTFYGLDENDVLGAELWAVSQARPLAQVQAAENLRRALDRAFEALGRSRRGHMSEWTECYCGADIKKVEDDWTEVWVDRRGGEFCYPAAPGDSWTADHEARHEPLEPE